MSNFDYFYGDESEQFSFFRIPKLLFINPVFAQLSDSAKIMYGLFLDRTSLSRKNAWVDDLNRTYVIFRHEEIMEQLNCRTEKASKILAELDSKKGIGLIERVRRGLGKPDIIYVKNFCAILGTPENKGVIQTFDFRKSGASEIESLELRKSKLRSSENRKTGSSKIEIPIMSNTELNKTDSSKTEKRERTEVLSREEDIIEMSKNERELFDLFIEERKAAGKRTTRVQRNLLIQNLFLCGNTEIDRLEILEKTIQKGWLDFYPPDDGSPKAK